jgi:hypothetical protein
MNYFRIFLSFLILLFSTIENIFGENILISLSDGSLSSYDLTDVRKITFVTDSMSLHMTDGTVHSWSLDHIRNYRYDNSVDIGSLHSEAALKAFPNPSQSDITFAIDLDAAGPVSLRILDAYGRIINRWPESVLAAGEHVFHWSPKDEAGIQLPAGIYHCILTTSKSRLHKTILLD